MGPSSRAQRLEHVFACRIGTTNSPTLPILHIHRKSGAAHAYATIHHGQYVERTALGVADQAARLPLLALA